ncbi:unnamed protein product [Microthlaspi erraticum]|uniref:Uncharacterized protein n=1 Tax=Microthlaspi erraticum TaxID=1685480 RepID=A0A6D2K0Q3_9BRAS|nr:unnamed protein product [Microthlaspi erraticum]
MHIPPGFPHQPPQPAPTPEHELKAMLKQLLQGQADVVVETSKKLAEINSKIENLNTRVYSGKPCFFCSCCCKARTTTCEAVIDEFCMLLNDDDNVVAEAPGVQNDQPEVQATQIVIHTSPVESHNKLDRQLDRVEF